MADDTVTALVRKKGCMDIHWESGNVTRVPLALYRSMPLAAGARTGREEYGRRALAAEYPFAMETAARMLAVRDRSAEEIVRGLQIRGYSTDTGERVLRFLEEKRYVDDRRLSVEIAERLGGKRGVRQIRQRLRALGIDHDTAEEAIGRVPPQAQLAAAVALARKRLGRVKEETGLTAREKTLALLARKGFSYEVSREALKLAQEEPDP